MAIIVEFVLHHGDSGVGCAKENEGKPWKRIKKQFKLSENQREQFRTVEDYGKPWKMIENQGKLQKPTENYGKHMKIRENQKIIVEFVRHLGGSGDPAVGVSPGCIRFSNRVFKL